MADKVIKVVIGGDVSPIGRALPLFAQGESRKIFSDLLAIFEQAHMTVINLECSFINDQAKPILKDGPNLGVPDHCIKGIKNSHIAGVNLANNHSFDYGPEGLDCTIAACSRAGIFHFGADTNIEAAGRIFVHSVNGIRLGFMGMAEHEFSIAGGNLPGANPLDLINYVRTVSAQKKDFDFLIVLVHGGKEHYPYPTPGLMKLCRFLVEQGANAVICQHSHCPGSHEIHRGAPIIYGQGNLIFDRPGASQSWHEGFLVQLHISEKMNCSLEMIPYRQFQEKPCVELMHDAEKNEFLNNLSIRSERLSDNSFVSTEWQKYCLQEKYAYHNRLYGYNRLLRVINKKIHFSDWLYTEKIKMMVRNVVECETHREVLETLWRQDKE